MDISKGLKFAIAAILIVLVTSPCVFSDNIKVIKNPKPTMKETGITQLVKVGEIGPEVGKDQFLFSPVSFVMDDSDNLFVFDRMQSKIVKLDAQGKYVKSFGGFGEGPGEFGGKGKYYMAFLTLANDNLIYANDIRRWKVLVFDTEGKYLNQIKYKGLMLVPVPDGKGDILFSDTKNEVLEIFNGKGDLYYSYPIKEKKIQYLFRDITKIERKKRRKPIPRKSPYHLQVGELILKITRDGKLLLYFSGSATLLVIKDKKLLKEINVWPVEALKLFKSQIELDEYSDYPFFSSFFFDLDEPDVLYFNFKNRKSRINRLYRVNLQGQLLSVINVPEVGDGGYPKFKIEKNGKFYAVYDDKVIIFEEASK